MLLRVRLEAGGEEKNSFDVPDIRGSGRPRIWYCAWSGTREAWHCIASLVRLVEVRR